MDEANYYYFAVELNQLIWPDQNFPFEKLATSEAEIIITNIMHSKASAASSINNNN
jgi:hypothetical protein